MNAHQNFNRALVIVDMQNDFCEGGALAVTGGRALVPIINNLQKKFSFIVATQDWHPQNHGSFASHYPGAAPGALAGLNGHAQILWPDHCVQNTRGADFADGLDASRWCGVFQKGCDPGCDSYSGVKDQGGHSTGLAEYLRDIGVGEVYVVGLATDYCVKATALDLRAFGFATRLVTDACAGVNLQPGDSTNAIKEMVSADVELTVAKLVTAEEERPEYVRLHAHNAWRWVHRCKGAGGVAAIVATVTETGRLGEKTHRLVLTEQYRTPVSAGVIDLPAGLVGDHANEDVLTAASRELAEETGYEARDWQKVAKLCTSPGQSSEVGDFVRARNCVKVGRGGGVVGEENITVHEVDVTQPATLLKALTKWQIDGKIIDVKVWAAYGLLQAEWQGSS